MTQDVPVAVLRLLTRFKNHKFRSRGCDPIDDFAEHELLDAAVNCGDIVTFPGEESMQVTHEERPREIGGTVIHTIDYRRGPP